MLLETKEWNEVNPTREKPKFGRGVLTKEFNGVKDQVIGRLMFVAYILGTEHGLLILLYLLYRRGVYERVRWLFKAYSNIEWC